VAKYDRLSAKAAMKDLAENHNSLAMLQRPKPELVQHQLLRKMETYETPKGMALKHFQQMERTPEHCGTDRLVNNQSVLLTHQAR
jgi:hypothetical protein